MKDQPPPKVSWEVLGDLVFLVVVLSTGYILLNNDAIGRYIAWLLTIKF